MNMLMELFDPRHKNSWCSILDGMDYVLSDNDNNKESDGTITDNSNQESIIIHTFLSNKNSSSQNSGSSIDNKRYFQTQTTKTSTKTGEVRTNKKHSSPSQNNKKIFSIKKINKQKGRKKAKSKSKNHDKFSEDNIVQKAKAFFVKNLIRYINKIYSDYTKGKHKELLKKLKPQFSQVYSKTDNQEFLKKSVKDFVSMDISKKCTKVNDPEFNKKQIEKLYKKNEAKDLIKILDLNLGEIYAEYVEDKNKEFSFEQDLNEQKNNWESEYIEKFKKIAIGLIGKLSKKGKTKKVIFNPSKNCKDG